MSFILWELPIAAGMQLIDIHAARSGVELSHTYFDDLPDL
jgi:hypothetical protein